jgi:diacylglycerol kinase (ATP)
LKKFIDSINHSLSGIIHAFKTEKNMKIHFAISFVVILLSILTHVTRFELIAIIISITLVVLAELFNTAVEAIVDLITDQYHELARIAKNVAAGAVTITALNAVVVGYLVFYRKISSFQLTSLSFFTDLSAHITFASLAIVCVIVIAIKSRKNAKNVSYLQGGMPSGHTAIAFALFMAVTLISNQIIVSSVTFILALVVAESRLETKVHTFLEVLTGALIGVGVTYLMFILAELLKF